MLKIGVSCRPVLGVLFVAGGLTCISGRSAAWSQAPAGTSTNPLPAAAPEMSVARSSGFHITGRVIDQRTKAPVPKATLSAVPMTSFRRNRPQRREASSDAATAVTDEAGHFDLAVPSAAGWSLTAAARGFASQALDEHEGFSTAVVLTSVAPTLNLEFPLSRSATIEGYVLDEAGEAVRDGQVRLSLILPAAPAEQHPRPQLRSQQRTDDRGYYKFSGLAAGNYNLSVTAQPWYATTNRVGKGAFGQAGSAPASESQAGQDPLDVVYPVVWFPGVMDPSAATPINLHGGDTREADFRLLPMPAYHLHIPAEQASTIPAGAGERHAVRPRVTFIARIMPDGSEQVQPLPMNFGADGGVDVAGLSPGNYEIRRAADNGNGDLATTTLQIGANSPRTLDLGQGSPAARVIVRLDAAERPQSTQVQFRSLETGHIVVAQRDESSSQASGTHSQASDNPPPSQPESPTIVYRVELQPGKYEVFLSGGGDLHLASIEGQGAIASGRTVTIAGGSPMLALHAARGWSTISGFVNFAGHVDVGAMVLLIPATLGDAAGLDVPRRDQTNTDGSFELENILPGKYILVAVDHGWDLNWSDPATLVRFLERGMPIEFTRPVSLTETIQAQLP